MSELQRHVVLEALRLVRAIASPVETPIDWAEIQSWAKNINRQYRREPF